jgi:hypothetical protein
LNLSYPDNVAEYQIDPVESSFRFWQDPLSQPTAVARSASNTTSSQQAVYEVTSNDCFTALTFQASSIYDQSFNLTGTDELLWAANGENYYVTYHGSNRGRFAIDWTTGSFVARVSPKEEETNATTPKGSTTDSASGAGTVSSHWLMSGLVGVFMLLSMWTNIFL